MVAPRADVVALLVGVVDLPEWSDYPGLRRTGCRAAERRLLFALAPHHRLMSVLAAIEASLAAWPRALPSTPRTAAPSRTHARGVHRPLACHAPCGSEKRPSTSSAPRRACTTSRMRLLISSRECAGRAGSPGRQAGRSRLHRRQPRRSAPARCTCPAECSRAASCAVAVSRTIAASSRVVRARCATRRCTRMRIDCCAHTRQPAAAAARRW
jgi:hypothetical protein